MRNSNTQIFGSRSNLAILLSMVLLAVAPGISAEEEVALTFDNLVKVKDPEVAVAFIDPDADFSVFKRVTILEPMVAFRSNWQRDQNRSRSRNISTRDMDRIKEDVATQFERVFTERLEAAGYEVVEVPVNWSEIPGGSMNVLRESTKMFLGLFRLRQRLAQSVNRDA